MRRACRVLPVLALLLVAGAARAGLAPTSPEQPLSEIAGERRQPAVATNNGKFLAVWTDQAGGSRIRGRLFSVEGNLLGNEIALSPDEQATVDAPDVAALGTGFVVAWRERPAGDEARPRLVARILDPDGIPLGASFPLDTARALPVAGYYISAPSIAARADGFVATWISGTRKDTPLYRSHEDAYTYVRHFTPAGAPTSPDFALSGYVTGESGPLELEPRVLPTSAGFLAISPDNFFGGPRVWRLGPLAEVLAAPVDVWNAGGSWARMAPHAQSFHLVWSKRVYAYRRSAATVLSRRVSLEGELLQAIIPLSAQVGPDPSRIAGEDGIAAAHLSRGRVLAVWASRASEEPSEVGKLGIVARIADGRGHFVQDEFAVSEIADGVAAPELAVLDDSLVAVVWESGDGDVRLRTLRIFSPECGDGDEDGAVLATDALSALRSAVGLVPCDACVCDADGSGSHSAADALVVLRVAVGLADDLACPVCSEGIGIPFDVSSACSGAHVTIPREALPANLDLVSCSLEPSLVASSCKASVTVGEEGLVFDARAFGYAGNCPLSGAVFACHVPTANVGAMASSAAIGCACSCRECAEPASLCASADEGRACSPEAPGGAVASAAKRGNEAPREESGISTSISTSTTINPTSSSTSFCGTCCNMDELGQLLLESSEPITTLLVRIGFHDYSGGCLFCYGSGSIEADIGSGGPEAREICIVDHAGIEGPLKLADCEGYGNFDPGTFEILSARGINFTPVAAPPALSWTGP